MKSVMRGSDYFDLSGSGSRAGVWHWWIGLGLIILGELFAIFFAYSVAYALLPLDWLAPAGEGARGGFGDYLVLFAIFIPSFLVPLLLWRYLNGARVARLLSWTGRIRWGFMARAFAVVMLAYLVLWGVDYQLFPDSCEGMERQTDWRGYVILLLITLLLCPIQASSEELMLRGYAGHILVQTLTALRANPAAAIWFAYIATSALFASLHLANPESEGQVGPYMASTFLYAMAMCVLVHVEGGLESAIGYHIANNIFVFSILGYVDPMLPNSALFWMPEIVIGWSDVVWDTLVMSGLVALIIIWNRRSGVTSKPDPVFIRS